MFGLYVVSIEDEHSPRWEKFIQQNFFQNSTKLFVKVGIKGVDLPTKQYFELGVKGRTSILTPGEVGCTLSHLDALKIFLKTDEQYALILEDDAVLPDHFCLKKLEEELTKVPLNSKFLFSLSGIQLKVCHNVRGQMIEQLFFNKRVLRVVPDFYHRVCSTVAYVVDRSMAETLIKYHTRLRRADYWSCLCDFDRSVNIYMTHIIDHPILECGEENQLLSCIESERIKIKDLENSHYGFGLRKNIAKIFYKKYKH